MIERTSASIMGIDDSSLGKAAPYRIYLDEVFSIECRFWPKWSKPLFIFDPQNLGEWLVYERANLRLEETVDITPRYLEPTQESGKALMQRHIIGPVVMLNLLRFRAIADYSAMPHLAPAESISGEAAYKLYIEYTLPHLEKSGGSLVFLGKGGNFLIGPPNERWDLVMLVRQSSVASFIEFALNQDYLIGLGHRTAAIEDSRILPLLEGTVAELF